MSGTGRTIAAAGPGAVLLLDLLLHGSSYCSIASLQDIPPLYGLYVHDQVVPLAMFLVAGAMLVLIVSILSGRGNTHEAGERENGIIAGLVLLVMFASPYFVFAIAVGIGIGSGGQPEMVAGRYILNDHGIVSVVTFDQYIRVQQGLVRAFSSAGMVLSALGAAVLVGIVRFPTMPVP